MIEITEAAQKQLENYFADKDRTPIRIYLATGGWAGPRLALALDEPKDNDVNFEIEGFTFLLDKDLNEQGSPFRVDLSYTGFVIDSKIELGGGGECGSCSGSCG